MKETCQLSWAIIPTAGRGTRLRPATNTIPKVLLPVGLRPMIDWAIDEALEERGGGGDYKVTYVLVKLKKKRYK